MASYELATRHELRERARRKKRRHWIEFGTVLALLATWWLTLAPVQIGGPITYAVVAGHSMEPMLYTGDLVLTKKQSHYELGDTVLTSVMGGYVIHDVVWQHGNKVRTRGVNNDFDDTWLVPTKDILGKYQFKLSGFGTYLVYLRTHPLVLALFAAVVAGILMLDPRKRRYSRRLKLALKRAHKELPANERDVITPLLTGLFVLTAISMLSTGILLANKATFYPRVALSLVGVLISVVAFEVIGNWLAGGRDLAEPYRSFEVFRNRLYRLTDDVLIPGSTVVVNSARELLRFAEISNSPVLHSVSEEGAKHEFLVVTDELNYAYRVNAETPVEGGKVVSRHSK